MKKAIVIGGGGHAKVVLSVLKKLPHLYIPTGYVAQHDTGPLLGIPFISSDATFIEKQRSQPEQFALFLGIGKVHVSDPRPKIVAAFIEAGFEFPPLVSPHAIINEDVTLGMGVVVLDGAIVQPSTTIDDFATLNTRCSVDHDSHIGAFAHIAPGATLSGQCSVGAGSLVGVGATMLQGTSIGEQCILAAGACLIHDMADYQTYAGVPAKRIKVHTPAKS